MDRLPRDCDTEEESTSPGVESSSALSHPTALDVAKLAARSPALLRVLQCSRPLADSELYSLRGVDCAHIGRGVPPLLATPATQGSLDVSISDSKASRRHARLTRQGARFTIEDVGSKNGVRVEGRTIRCDELANGALIEIGETFFVYREHLDRSGVNHRDGLPGLRTFVPELERQLCMLNKAAQSNVNILLLGETGTGKEVVARAVHEASGRSGPFAAVNCGGIPGELIESELFGVRRGAYSGALDSRPGYVRAAAGGTLFLDEVGELAPASQAALLRVLSTHEVVPIGDTRPISVDFRVIAATNRDLEAAVRSGQFRADLFARISGLTVELPPLRQRREDLGLLIGDLLRRHRADPGVTLSAEAARALFLYSWPFNVRELENVLQAAIALGGERLELPPLPPTPSDRRAAAANTDTDTACRDRLEALLVVHRGNISAVAREMGKDRIQIRRWLRRFGWDADSFRTSQ